MTRYRYAFDRIVAQGLEPLGEEFVSMVRRIIIGMAFYVVVGSAPAQVISIDTYRQQGKKVELPTRGFPGFSFHELDTMLTDTARLYLDVFAQHYRDSLFPDRQYVIELTNSVTDVERERDSSLWHKRAMAIIHYLDANYGMQAQNFRGRCQQTTTSICIGVISTKRPSRSVARSRRRP